MNTTNYQMKIVTWGNPDHNQDPSKPPYGLKPALVKDTSLAGLRKQVRQWQEQNNCGGGNWGSPAVMLNGKTIGYMSYNCKVWDRSVWSQQAQEVA